MKKNTSLLLLLISIICLSNQLNAQDRKYPVELPTFNFLSHQYTIGAEITAYEQYKITLKDSVGSGKVISLSPFTIDKFKKAIKAEFKQLTDSDIYNKYITNDSAKTDIELNKIFFAFKAADIAIEDLDSAPEAMKLYFKDDVWVWKAVSIPNKEIRHMIRNIRNSKHHDFLLLIKDLRTELKTATDTFDIRSDTTKYLQQVKPIINELTLNKIEKSGNTPNNEEFRKIKSAINDLAENTPKIHDLKVITHNIDIILNKAVINDPINDWYFYKVNIFSKRRYIYQGNRYKRRKTKKLLKKQWVDREYGKKITEYNEEYEKNLSIKSKYYESKKSLDIETNKLDDTTIKDLQLKEKINVEIVSLNEAIEEINDKIEEVNKKYLNNDSTYKSLTKPFKALEFIKNDGDNKKTINNLNQFKIENPITYNLLEIIKKNIDSANRALSIIEPDSDRPSNDKNPDPLVKYLDEISDQLKKFNPIFDDLNKKGNGLSKNLLTYNNEIEKLEALNKKDTIKLKSIKQELESFQNIHNTNIKNLIQSINKLLSIKIQFPKIELKINEIELEINDGFIENISVIGDIAVLKEVNVLNDKLTIDNPLKDENNYNSRKIKFENYVPIGFSRRQDFRNFNHQYLFGELQIKNEILIYKLNLSEIFPLINEKLAVDRRDYSPKNQYVSIDPKNSINKFISLKKETTAKLFEAKVYSDFVGFDEANPNGLIQTEIHKYIPIDTKRHAFKKTWWNWFNYGFFGYMEPFVVISKIENNSKNLKISTIDRFVNGNYSPIKYASTLEIKRRESFRTGFTFNAITLDFPRIRSTFLFNLAFSYGITPAEYSIKTFENNKLIVSDALDEFKINTYTVTGPEIIWEIRSDERYGFNIVARMDWYWARSNRFIQVSNEEAFEETRDIGADPNRLNSIELNGFLKTSDTSSGRLFFRYRFNWQKNYWKTGFNQLQVGYSFYILKRSES